MKSAQCLKLLVILLVGMSDALAAQNAPPSGEPAYLTDGRLTSPDTITPSRQLVSRLLLQLQKAGRPTLLTSGDFDRQSVIVYTKDYPVRSVMTGLGQLLNSSWQPAKLEGTALPDSYKLVVNGRMPSLEEFLRETTIQRGEASLAQLAELTDAGEDELKQRTPALEKLWGKPDTASNLWLLNRAGPRAALRMYQSLSSAQRHTLLEEGRLILTSESMDARQQLLTGYMGFDAERLRRLITLPESEEDADTAAQEVFPLGLILKVGTSERTGAATSYSFGPGGAENYSAGSFDGRITPDLLPVRGNPYQYYGRTLPLAHPVLPRYPTLEQTAFPKEFAFKPTYAKSWEEVLRELSRHLPMPLFSDSYVTMYSRMDAWVQRPCPDLKGLSLVQALDTLCDYYHRCWWYSEGRLLFRSRTWFTAKQYEPPQSIIDSLQQQLTRQGKLNSKGLTQLNQLTARQLMGLSAGATYSQYRTDTTKVFAGGEGVARRVKGYLQVFALLDDAQQEQAMTSEGLSLNALSPEQQQTYLHFLVLINGREVLRRLPQTILKVTQNIKARTGVCWLMFSSTGDFEGLSQLTIPLEANMEADTEANTKDKAKLPESEK